MGKRILKKGLILILLFFIILKLFYFKSDNLNISPFRKSKDWELVLVNKDNPLKNGYIPETKEIGNGHSFDKRAIKYLEEMLDDCRNSGLNPLICSSYRSTSYQSDLYNNKIKQAVESGMSREEGEEWASSIIAYPGTSEHELGLAVDIVSLDYQQLDEKQENTAEYKWLKENCKDYGFILRYPKDKSEITGIIYEPWHFRYVGKDIANYIMENNITLEEYLEE